MTIMGFMNALAQAQGFLAQAGVPSGQDERNEGWGGLIGIGVILLAVWVTIVIIRRFGRERDEDEDGDKQMSRQTTDDNRQPAVGLEEKQESLTRSS